MELACKNLYIFSCGNRYHARFIRIKFICKGWIELVPKFRDSFHNGKIKRAFHAFIQHTKHP